MTKGDGTFNRSLGRRLRMALVGGAGGGFIGRVHVVAATLDNLADLVAGALSSNPERSRSAAKAIQGGPESEKARRKRSGAGARGRAPLFHPRR